MNLKQIIDRGYKSIIAARWIFAIIFLLISISTVKKGSYIAGFWFLVLGLGLIPPLFEYIKKYLPILGKRYAGLFAVVLLLALAGKSLNNNISQRINVDSLSAKNTIETTTTYKFIPGIKPYDIYGNFEKKGFTTDKQITADGSFFTNESNTDGILYNVGTSCLNSASEVSEIRLSATRVDPQFNKEIDMKAFLKFGCSIPYDNSDQEKVNQWIEENYFKDKANIIISGVKFTLFAPTEFVRTIQIEALDYK
jgi:hypothetical protein